MYRESNQAPGPRRTRRITPDEYDDYEDYEYEERPKRRRQPPRRRKAWPFVLAGCGLGIVCTVVAAAIIVFLAIRSMQGVPLKGLPGINGSQPFTQETTQNLSITSLSQLQICDKIGNVSIAVDPAATTPTIATRKIVQAISKDDAEQQFKQITIEIQPPGPITNTQKCPAQTTAPAIPAPTTNSSGAGTNPTALTIDIITPNNDNQLPGSSTAVDVSILLPPSTLPSDGPTLFLDVEAPVGKVTVSGLGGVLNIRGSTGDVVVNNVLLADGSHIETGQGSITFKGRLIVPPVTDQQKNPARFVIQSERGNIDATLPDTTSVTLDANTNVGSINSEFAINVQNTGDGPANYHGPLNPSATASPATLVLDVSTGNVNIHKTQA